MTLSELAAAWNAQADEHNQWDVLGLDEQIEFAVAQERERCAALCESTYPEFGGERRPCFDTPAECADAIRRPPAAVTTGMD